MINNVVITGCYKGFKKNNLLIKIKDLENHQVVRVYINETLRIELENHLKIDDIIGINSHIHIDDMQQIIIIATKITFLSKK